MMPVFTFLYKHDNQQRTEEAILDLRDFASQLVIIDKTIHILFTKNKK